MNGAFTDAKFFSCASDGGVCCGNILAQQYAAVLHVMAYAMVGNLPPIHFQNCYTPFSTATYLYAQICGVIRVFPFCF